ncbi:MAG: DUF4978 domain-containing protein [Lachnospiraceae bacterium]|nr:DUF4978 domain-containing protein [Lachnospiraceae bacterium]
MQEIKERSCIRKLPNGKKVIYVHGKPFQTYGIQIRLDLWRREQKADNKTIHEKGIFRWAKNLNCNTVQVPVCFRECEPSEGIYDWTNLDFAITECEENNLKLEIVWFGSDVCGSGWGNVTPDYIIDDQKTYQRILNENGEVVGGSYENGDGRKISLCRENDRLLERETKLLAEMMRHIKAFDKNGVVIGFQVENEPSIMQHNPTMVQTKRCFCNTCNRIFEKNGYTDDVEFSKDRLAVYLNKIARTVKDNIDIYTRVNFIWPYYEVDEDLHKILSCTPCYIDFIGIDTYGYDQMTTYKQLKEYFSQDDNMPHISELPGHQPFMHNCIIEVLAADGAGADVYRLAETTKGSDNFLLDENGNDTQPHTPLVRGIFGMLGRVMEDIAVRRSNEDIFYFNCFGSTKEIFTEQRKVNGTEIRFITTSSAIGIVIDMGDGTYKIMSTGNALFELQKECHKVKAFEICTVNLLRDEEEKR